MPTRETYLKVRQVAEALGVSVSTIQRLADGGSIAATRTSGGHRRVILSSVLDYARRERHPVEGLLALEDAPEIRAIEGTTVDRLLELLRQGRAREAAALIGKVHDSAEGAVGLADNLIRPTMERVGQGWMLGSWDIYQEHQATQIVSSSLAGLTAREASTCPLEGRPLALGASVEGDSYSLPVLLGELVIREVGWDVRNLGVNLPLKSLAKATRDNRPSLIFLSANHLPDPARFLHDYSYFYEAASSVGAAIILGGRALDADLRSKLVYASFGERMTHLAEFARTLLPMAATSLSRPTHFAN